VHNLVVASGGGVEASLSSYVVTSRVVIGRRGVGSHSMDL